VTTETFPANLPGRCCECSEPFSVGDPVAYVDEGTDDIGDVVCSTCAGVRRREEV
jgi:hypothetical protein